MWTTSLLCFLTSLGCFSRLSINLAEQNYDGRIGPSQLLILFFSSYYYAICLLEDFFLGGGLGMIKGMFSYPGIYLPPFPFFALELAGFAATYHGESDHFGKVEDNSLKWRDGGLE